jgi:hypothetical protein
MKVFSYILLIMLMPSKVLTGVVEHENILIAIPEG